MFENILEEEKSSSKITASCAVVKAVDVNFDALLDVKVEVFSLVFCQCL
jgi:hypothetical protein